jgi:amino acid adenylation domain-containing protein/thioester reductase-like protein
MTADAGPDADRYILQASFGQRRLWFLHELDPASSAAYVDHGALRLRGDLDLAAAQRAIDTLVDRHETLRTCLDTRDGEPVQVVWSGLRVPLEILDLGGRDLADAVREVAGRPFELTAPPLFRVAVLRIAPDEHVLVAAFHHSVYDQWSAGVFLREFLTCYAANVRGEEPDLPELPIQYGDYAAWQAESAEGEAFAEHVEYWKRQLRDLPPLDLPTDFPRPRLQTFRGATGTATLDPDLLRGLEEIARGENATLFMVLLAAFSAMLGFYSGQEDVAVGSPIAGRDLPELQNLIGFFVNNLVLRTDLSGSPSFRELVRRVRRTCLDAYANQDVPFDRLVDELRPPRDLSRSPLFQVMFVFGNVPLAATENAGLGVEMLRVDPGTAKFDLFLMLLPREGGDIEVTLEYNTALFDATTIAAMLRHYDALLRHVAGAPDRPVTPAAMITEEDTRLLERCGTGPAGLAGDKGVAALVAEQAARTPGRIAVADDEEEVTYAQLDARANRLAHHLRDLGVGPNEVVAVCLDRGVGLVVALLATLRAGGAYLPVDPDFPPDRVRYMLEDSGARVVVTDSRLSSSLPEVTGQVVDGGASLNGHPATPPGPGSGPGDLAYLIYTSGSTGRPKGVMVANRSLVNLLRSMAERPGITADDVLAAVTTVSFDIAALEIFLPLTVGARVEMVRREVASDGALLAHRLAGCEVSFMQATPATWRLLMDAGWSPDGRFTALCGGEAMPSSLGRELAAAGAAVWNMYGPTETTIWSSCHRLTGDEDLIPLGEPIAGTRLRVLDGARRPVPPGVPGEIHIGGDGLALGYRHRPDLTAERFVPDPGDPRRRLYRTGDAARLRADGRLEFLGRLDDQIKLHGFRIEPGEIVSVLREHPAVREAAVAVHEHGPGDRRLTAYVAPAAAGESMAEIWALLRGRLAAYLIPSSVTVLDRIPHTPNGKVDHKALPAPDTAGTGRTVAYRRPATEAERRVAAIWQEVLHVQRAGADDDFFTVGGNSLLATRVVAGLRRELGVAIPVRALFDRPTIAGLAELVSGRRAPAEKIAPLPRVPEPDGLFEGRYVLPASPGQRRLWFLQSLEPASGEAYVMFGAVRITGAIDPAALQHAVDAVAARHETLRTSFALRDGEPVQVVRPEPELPIRHRDLSALPAREREDRLAGMLREEARTPFDLGRAPLARVTLIKVGRAEHVLAVALHHGVSDGWSTGVLVRELVHCYEAGREGREPGLPELTVQYGDLAAAMLSAGDPDPESLAYWRRALAGAPVLDLPADRPRPPVQTFNGATLRTRLPAATVRRLGRLCDSTRVTPFMVLLAATSVVLGRYSRQDDLTVGSPIAARDRPETESMIGFCADNLVLRMRLDGDPTAGELLDRAREVCLGAYAHADVPFERLVEELAPDRDLARTPLFQVALSSGENPLPDGRLGEARLEPVDVDSGRAKFDLALLATPRGEEMNVAAEYNTDLFDAGTIERMLGQLALVIDAFAADPGRRLSELPALTAEESARLDGWARGPQVPLADAPAAALFEERVRERPDAVAVECGALRLTYRELNARANRLAHRLRGLGAGPGTLVGLSVERSADLVVAVLGALKSGGAYVPIDPALPPERVRFMLTDSRAPILVTQESLRETLPSADAEVVCLDGLSGPEEDPEPVNGPDDLAYVIYTSGSTGRPKGAMVTHRGVVNLHLTRERLGIGREDRMLQFATFSFDASVWEMVMALFGGGVLVVPTAEELAGGVASVIRDHGVTVTLLPPSLLAHLDPGDLPSLRTLVTGGEDCPADVAELWAPRTRFINAYGPTEVTVYATLSDPVTGRGHPPIGRPVTNARLRVVDPDTGAPVPIGAPGELLVAGAGVGAGYLGRPGLTAERFVPDPGGGRAYRTGDLVRYRSTGDLEFLGRIDDQVKLRGHRIELGEVEQVLREHPGVGDAAAVVREDARGDARLLAYVVPADGAAAPGEDALRAHARTRLPGYMVPAVVTALAELPLTPSRKVDRKALPDPRTVARGAGSPDGASGREPADETERAVRDILAAALETDRLGVEEDFFARGGHSLLAMRVLEDVRDRLGATVPVRRFFERPTAAGLAAAVHGLDADAGPDPRADVRLDPGIRPADRPVRTDGPPLVTGASGFLGGFVLAELLNRAEGEVVCLVRASGEEAGAERVVANLRALGVWRAEWRPRLRAVPGDLTRPYLGLPEAEFARLAGEISAIYHVGASVNLILPYSSIRGTNVTGTHEILRLAAAGGGIPVHHVSTASVFPMEERGGAPHAESELPADPPPAEIAYNQSKWVAEGLVELARERGVPVAVYRPGRITGDTVGGAWRTDDMICRLIRSFAVTGTAPDVDLRTDMQAVDALASAIVRLAAEPGSLGERFHFRAPRPVAIGELVDVLNTLGYQVERVPTREWYERCRQSAGDALSATEAEMFRRRIDHHTSGMSEPVLDCATTERLLGPGAPLPQIDQTIMRRYVERMIATGFLSPPGERRTPDPDN